MPKARSFFTFERIILICAGFFLYAITLLNGYAIDDTLVTVKPNLTTEGVKVIPKLLTSGYGADDTGKSYDYRPMVKISYALEHSVFGVSPGVSHFFNVLFYLCCVLLVYRFLTMFLEEKKSRMPFYIALLFAFLPIHTEVVASLKNRDVLLCFIFCMLSCIRLLKAYSSPKKKWLHLLLAWVLLYLAFLSKFDALPFIAILPLLVFIKFKPGAKVLVVLFLVFSAVYILNRVNLRLVSGPRIDRGVCYFENPLYFNKSIPVRTAALFNCLGFYTAQCALPRKQVCYYGVDTINVTSLSRYGFLGIGVALALISGLVYAFKKNRQGLLLGLLMFGASASMYLNFFQPAVGIVADRFIFFGSLGFCMTVLFLIEPFWARRKKILSVLAFGVLGLYGALTFLRAREWKNSATLIAADYPKYPNSAFLNYLYATAIMDTVIESKETGDAATNARVSRIKDCLRRSLFLSNDYPKALGFLSSVLVFMDKDYKAALPVINRGLEVQKSPDLIFYKGICLHQLKEYDSSEVYLLETVELNPSPHPAYGLLMENYLSRGACERSLELFNSAMKRGYENQQVFNGLATTYLALNDTLSVEFYCQKTLAIDPENKEAKELLNRIVQR